LLSSFLRIRRGTCLEIADQPSRRAYLRTASLVDIEAGVFRRIPPIRQEGPPVCRAESSAGVRELVRARLAIFEVES